MKTPSPATFAPKRPRRRLLRMFLLCVSLYLLASLAVMLTQRRMIYHPMVADARLLLTVARNDGFEPWLNATGQPIGWKRRSPAQPSRGLVLIVHGNAGYALHRVDYAKALQAVAPFDAFILEYPGYGSRPGRPSQKALCAAAEEALLLLRTHGPVHLIGESLGTGVAAQLARAHPSAVAGLLLFTPFNNLASVAQHHMPLFPVRWMLWDRFPSDEALRDYRGPVGILLAGNDQVVPDKFGRRLYEGFPGPKKLWESPNAGHNDIYNQSPDWWRQVVAFWESPLPPGK